MAERSAIIPPTATGPLERHARRIVAELELDRVLERLLEAARELTGARHVAVGLFEEHAAGAQRLVTLDSDPHARAVIGKLPGAAAALGPLVREPVPFRLPGVPGPPLGGSPERPLAAHDLLGVPLRVHDRIAGVLYLAAEADGELGESAEKVGSALAGWACVAMENALRLRAEVVRRQALEENARRYEAMTEIARAVGGVPDLERVLAVVAERTRALTDARASVITLVEGEDLAVSAAAGEQAPMLMGRRYPRRGSLAGHALERRRAVHLHELAPGLAGGLVLDRLRPAGALAYPLIFRGRPLGVIAVFDRRSNGPSFTLEDALVLEGIANSAAAGVATAQGAAAHSLRRSIAAAERERQRWARELHDQTLQDLAGLRLIMDALPDVRDPDQARALLARASERVSEAIVQLRHLVAELRPLVLDDLGIEPALQALAERMGSLTPASISMDVDFDYDSGRAAVRLSPEVEETIYRVVQESLTNSLKHAAAEHIAVVVRERDGMVEIEVSDDGRGFPTNGPDQGFGLIGMRERLDLVSGTLAVSGDPDHGTTVRAAIPVARVRVAGTSSGAAA